MKVIKIEHPQTFNPEDFPELVLAMGFFDGVHKGHQKVIMTAKEIAEQRQMKSAVMTFDPHPSVVLGKNAEGVRYITPLEDKIKMIEELGIDFLFIIHFSQEFAQLEPQQFVDQYIAALNVRHAVGGFDYSYGRFGKGTMENLPEFAKGRFTQTVVAKQSLEEEKVSSTRIRKTLSRGDFKDYHHLVGRYYSTRGRVIHGEKRGRKLGFPTANIELLDTYIFPAPGVYAVRIKFDDRWHEAVCNVGYKPTFHKEKPEFPSIEVHIFDFNQDVYGEEAAVEWHCRLRSEKKFNGVAELIEQIEHDKQNALRYFKETGQNLQ
ncbi:bifunctional riboflavin kinase/FAD synthetase [Bacillus massiliglaciei]|uniref:bifunctional riboflavin kinase/FAD synthetase n=1 Tax=Bacillus massiliglaciei TaxID=1816693 RepID=UPI000ACA9A9E|nr:bifunctional riboflavin kinase/FAD synthetase [Bacillus massiliglaciei]